ncbi:MAG: TlpA family protein disulfide reductase [Chitinophagaceae bacterium]
MQILKKRCLTILLFQVLAVLSFSKSKAQDALSWKLGTISTIPGPHPLTYGELVPNIDEKIIHYQKAHIRFSDLRGKLVILDFWHQYCSSCVAQLPKFAQLQKQFGNKILILPVTFQSKISILDFYQKRKKMGRPLLIPSIVEDTLLSKSFPHPGDPYEVWINGEGRVIEFTDFESVCAPNIEGILQNPNFQIPQQKFQVSFNIDSPLLIHNNGGPDNGFLFRSMITAYNDSITQGLSEVNLDSSRTRIIFTNLSLIDLYREAYFSYDSIDFHSFPEEVPWRRILLKTLDSSKFENADEIRKRGIMGYEEAQKKFIFNYELILPPNFTLHQAYGIMIRDLDGYFQVHSFIAKRDLEGFVLRRIPGRKINRLGINYIEPSKQIKKLHSHTILIGDFINFLNGEPGIPYVLDRTDYSGYLNFKLDYKLSHHLAYFQKELIPYGLELTKTSMPMPVLVLKDLENPHQ